MQIQRPIVNTAAIVGVGLMGGSIGLALRRRNVAGEVVGIDRQESVVSTAIRRGMIHRGGQDLRLVAGTDLVIIAVPVEAIPATAEALAPYIDASAVVTDVGSVKEPVVRAIEGRLPEIRYVGGHPMAGSEGSGIEQADAALLDGRPFILTPTERTDGGALETMIEVVKGMGMLPVTFSPREHDRLVARVSHLPYLIAVTLLEAFSRDDASVAGPAYRDATRVAASPPAMWEEICRLNREAILQAMGEFERVLGEVKAAVSGEAPLDEILRRAQERRMEMHRSQVPAPSVSPPR